MPPQLTPHIRLAEDAYDGPLRKTAHRGTEVFVVAENELRWSSLAHLKDTWEESKRRGGVGEHETDRGHRVRDSDSIYIETAC